MANIGTETAKSQPNFGRKIYTTTYKKGQMLGHFNFEHDGDIYSALSRVRSYLDKKYLRHIQTMPFLVDLDADEDPQAGLIGP